MAEIQGKKEEGWSRQPAGPVYDAYRSEKGGVLSVQDGNLKVKYEEKLKKVRGHS